MSRKYQGQQAEQQYRQGYSDGWEEAARALGQLRQWQHPNPLDAIVRWWGTSVRSWKNAPSDRAIEAPELDAENFRDS